MAFLFPAAREEKAFYIQPPQISFLLLPSFPHYYRRSSSGTPPPHARREREDAETVASIPFLEIVSALGKEDRTYPCWWRNWRVSDSPFSHLRWLSHWRLRSCRRRTNNSGVKTRASLPHSRCACSGNSARPHRACFFCPTPSF